MASTMPSSAGAGGAGGGFISPSLPSPAPSTALSSTASTMTPSRLPRQRAHPLRSGSMKESALINHIDRQILRVNRRHAKKFSSVIDDDDDDGTTPESSGEFSREETGYESFREVVRDIEGIVDVVWVSGTPSLQIPYLISLAGLVNTYLPSYPFSPASTLRLLKKLDAIFASLLAGEDVESGGALSGFETTRKVVSMTEKVRIKSLAETARVAVVEAREMEEEEDEMDLDEDDDDDNDDDDVFGTEDFQPGPGRWEMEAARIYERTIQLLGDELGKGELLS